MTQITVIQTEAGHMKQNERKKKKKEEIKQHPERETNF